MHLAFTGHLAVSVNPVQDLLGPNAYAMFGQQRDIAKTKQNNSNIMGSPGQRRLMEDGSASCVFQSISACVLTVL